MLWVGIAIGIVGTIAVEIVTCLFVMTPPSEWKRQQYD